MGDSKKRAKRKPSQLTDISSVLQSLFADGKSPLSDQFIKFKLIKSWKNIAGPTAGSSSLPVTLSFGKLVIWVKSSTRLQELRFMEATLIKSINEFLGSKIVKEIRFTLEDRRASAPEDTPDQIW